MKKYLARIFLFFIITVFSFASGILIAEIKIRTAGKSSATISVSHDNALRDANIVLKIKPASVSTSEIISEDIPRVAGETDIQDDASAAEETPENITRVTGATDTRDDIFAPEKTSEYSPAVAKAIDTQNAKNKNSFSFAVLGDTQAFEDIPYTGNLQKAVNSIESQNVDFVLTVGDLIFRCLETNVCQKSYNNWKNTLSALLPKTYEVVGNHDRGGGTLADDVWQKEFGNLPSNGTPALLKQVYSFDYQNSHFVVLDSEKPHASEISNEERDWLEKDLSAHPKAHTFVFYHRPAFETSTHGEGNCLDANSNERDKFWKILADHNVTAVFNGHEHIFTRKKIGNIYQFVIGNTDAPLQYDPDSKLSDYSYKGHFYAITTVSGRKVNVSLYSVDGKLINSFDFS